MQKRGDVLYNIHALHFNLIWKSTACRVRVRALWLGGCNKTFWFIVFKKLRRLIGILHN